MQLCEIYFPSVCEFVSLLRRNVQQKCFFLSEHIRKDKLRKLTLVNISTFEDFFLNSYSSSSSFSNGLQNTRWSYVWDFIGTSRLLLWWYFTGVSFKLCSYWDIRITHFQLCAPMTSYRHIISFLRGTKNAELWWAITSSKNNIFWCDFFVRSDFERRLDIATKNGGSILGVVFL